MPGASIGLTDDFFDLGGHSLLATRLVSALRRHRVWQEVSVGEVYHHLTLAALAQRLDDIARRPTQPHTEAAEGGPRATAAPPPGSGDTPAAQSRRHRWCGAAQVTRHPGTAYATTRGERGCACVVTSSDGWRGSRRHPSHDPMQRKEDTYAVSTSHGRY